MCIRDRDDAGAHLRQALADELTQRIGIVRVDRHDVAVRVRVKVADGKALHVSEEFHTDVAHRSLRDGDHDAVVRPGACLLYTSRCV